MTVFVLMTGEWVDAMDPGVGAVGGAASLYYLGVVIVGRYLIINLLIAIVLNAFPTTATSSACMVWAARSARRHHGAGARGARLRPRLGADALRTHELEALEVKGLSERCGRSRRPVVCAHRFTRRGNHRGCGQRRGRHRALRAAGQVVSAAPRQRARRGGRGGRRVRARAAGRPGVGTHRSRSDVDAAAAGGGALRGGRRSKPRHRMAARLLAPPLQRAQPDPPTLPRDRDLGLVRYAHRLCDHRLVDLSRDGLSAPRTRLPHLAPPRAPRCLRLAVALPLRARPQNDRLRLRLRTHRLPAHRMEPARPGHRLRLLPFSSSPPPPSPSSRRSRICACCACCGRSASSHAIPA